MLLEASAEAERMVNLPEVVQETLQLFGRAFRCGTVVLGIYQSHMDHEPRGRGSLDQLGASMFEPVPAPHTVGKIVGDPANHEHKFEVVQVLCLGCR